MKLTLAAWFLFEAKNYHSHVLYCIRTYLDKKRAGLDLETDWWLERARYNARKMQDYARFWAERTFGTAPGGQIACDA